MNVEIEYCAPCGYRKRADAAAAALAEQLGLCAELVPGKGGVFRVYVNGKEVIARTKGHFPSPEEIVAAVANRRMNDCLDSGAMSRTKRS